MGVRGGVGGGGEGVGLTEILQAMQMDQSPLYTSQGFGGGGGSSDGGGLRDQRCMRPWRRSGWRRFFQSWGTSSSSYQPCLVVRGQCGPMISHARPN